MYNIHKKHDRTDFFLINTALMSSIAASYQKMHIKKDVF